MTIEPALQSPESQARDQILRSHRELAAVLGDLAGEGRADRLADNLAHLHEVLGRHFALEEQDQGLYAILRVRARGEDRAAIDALLAEHATMMADLRVLLAQARARPSPLIVARTQALCDRLRDHERRETRLLVQALSGEAEE